MNWTNKSEPQYKTILCALLAGAGAGLAVGMLMAPKSGDQLRAEIGSAVDDYMDSARSSASNIANWGRKAKDAAADQVDHVKDSVRSAVDTGKDTVRSAVDTGAKEAHNAIDQTVAKVNSGARKGHDAVDHTADAIRSGTRA